MKRSVALAPLSREHHAALSLAKQARRFAAQDVTDDDVRRFRERLAETFATALAPHFRIEESTLLPALRAAGEEGRVERTLSEHAELRALCDRIGCGRYDAALLSSFSDAMEAHVRFEERELFPLAESVLAAESLAAVGAIIHRENSQEDTA